jgi:hypothetical protein
MTDSEVTRETVTLRRRFRAADAGLAAAASVPSTAHDAQAKTA